MNVIWLFEIYYDNCTTMMCLYYKVLHFSIIKIIIIITQY